MKEKQCTKCSNVLNISNFRRRRLKDAHGHHSWCRDCENASFRLKRLNNIRRLKKYFEMHGCVDCGEKNPIKLTFDHRDDVKKQFKISAKLKCSWDFLKKEIDKCDVRCANCHQVRTAKQFNYYWIREWPELGEL